MWCSDAVETLIKQHFIEIAASSDVHQNHIKWCSCFDAEARTWRKN